MIPLTLPTIIFSTYPKVDIAIFEQVLLKSDLCPVFNLVLGEKKIKKRFAYLSTYPIYFKSVSGITCMFFPCNIVSLKLLMMLTVYES
jgi:hypothetical protein